MFAEVATGSVSRPAPEVSFSYADLGKNTVKLHYSDHGYNKLTLITKKIMSHFWSQIMGFIIYHSSNEKNFDGPRVFIITELTAFISLSLEMKF